MKTLKKLKDAAIYKFGIISPVLHDSVMVQAQYFRQLWQKGVAIPPNSDNIYYFKPATFKSWLRKYKKGGLDALKYKERNDKGVYKKITAAVKEKQTPVDTFSQQQALELLHDLSGGIHRKITKILEKALIYGAANKIELIDQEAIYKISAEI